MKILENTIFLKANTKKLKQYLFIEQNSFPNYRYCNLVCQMLQLFFASDV